MDRKFTIERGRGCVLRIPNIDTDIIIPQTELVTVSKAGLGEGLFARWRYVEGRTPNTDFALNKPANRDCRFLVAAENFGCGSSREHAVWALQDFGIRAVISPKFGEIFYRNCIRNCLLPALVMPDDYARLAALADADGGLELVVDLVERRIDAGGISVRFSVDDGDRHRLLNGMDEIGETLRHAGAIETFITADRQRRPWVYDVPWAT